MVREDATDRVVSSIFAVFCLFPRHVADVKAKPGKLGPFSETPIRYPFDLSSVLPYGTPVPLPICEVHRQQGPNQANPS